MIENCFSAPAHARACAGGGELVSELTKHDATLFRAGRQRQQAILKRDQAYQALHRETPCFVDARGRFTPQLFRESAPHTRELEQALREREAVLNITLRVMSDAHSLTVFAEGERLFVRDTGGRKGFRPIEHLEEIGKLLNAVLYVPKGTSLVPS